MPSLRIVMTMVLVLTGCISQDRRSLSAGSIGQSSIQGHETALRGKGPDAPVLVRKKNGHYRVSRPWTVTLGDHTWLVQEGYVSNGITAPDLVKQSLGNGVDAPETWAAVFHDWLFTQPGVTRSEADRSFYQILIDYGVPSTKASLMYTCVATYSASKAIR